MGKGEECSSEQVVLNKEERTGEEDGEAPGFSDRPRPAPPRRGVSLLTLGLLVAVALLAGIGAGFGIGWASRGAADDDGCGTPSPAEGPSVTVYSNIDRLLPLRPLSALGEASNAAVAEVAEQWARVRPALVAIAPLVSAIANDSSVVDAHVLRLYVASLADSPAAAALQAGLMEQAQRLLVNPRVPARLYDVTWALVRVFRQATRAAQLNGNLSSAALGGGGGSRRLLQAGGGAEAGARGGANAAIYALVVDALNHPALVSARGVLLELYQQEPLQDLLVALWLTLRSLAADMPALRELAAAAHPDPPPPVLGTQEVVVEAGQLAWAGGAPLTVLPDLPPLVALEEEEGGGPGTDGTRRRRRLAAAVGPSVMTEPPPGFAARPPGDKPPLLIPLVFHILAYRNDDRSLGPPGLDSAARQVARLLGVANALAAPAGVQLFAREVRADTDRWPYLLTYGTNRTTWLRCAADSSYAYELCGGVMRSAAADFPRSINVFVVSDGPPAKYYGYAFAPGSATDPLYGHVGLTWQVVNTGGGNGQSAYETGAVTLWHEVMHHLGLPHTFSTNGTCTEEAADGLPDTPVTSGPVWGQPWATDAYVACLQAVQYDMQNDWARIYSAWRTRLGIPAGDQRPFAKSCPGKPGQDELANYVTYSYDSCYAAYGHATPDQVRAMHVAAARDNPLLYAWAQYYALNPPPEAVAGRLPASTPPPPPPSDAASSLRICPPQFTRSGCRCKDSWTYDGVVYNGCVTPQGGNDTSTWCAVVLEDGCGGPSNGWWDRCVPVATLGCRLLAPSPPPSPPPPSSPPPPAPPPPSATATVNCGPGAPTRQGLTCTTGRWTTAATGGARFSGCANPDSRPEGPWCALAKGSLTPSGANWDLCLPRCGNTTAGGGGANSTTGGSGSVPQPALGCTSTAQGLPTDCTCRASWAAKASNGSTVRVSGCASFLALDPRPVCVVEGCRQRRLNGQVHTCTCPVAI